MQKTQSSFYPRIFAVVSIGLLAVAIFAILRPFAGAIAWALLFAFLMHPAHVRLTAWLRGRESLSSALLTAAALVVFLGPLTALGVSFAQQASSLIERLQSNLGGIDLSRLESLRRIPGFGRVMDWIQHTLGVSSEQLQTWGTSASQSALKYFAAFGGTVFKGAVGSLIGFIMMMFLLYFFLRDGAAMQNKLLRLVPMAETAKRELVRYLAVVTRAVVFGTLLTAMIQGALVSIAFLIVGLPSPVVFGVLAAALSLLPIGGTALVWVPAALILLSQGRYGAAIFMTIWGALLVGLIDNFLKPLLISGRAEVPTLAAFLGVLGGLAAFGAIGMFIGPILLALTIALLDYAEDQKARNA